MTILEVSVLQLSQSFTLNFTSFRLSDGSGSGNQSMYSGNSTSAMSGSGSGRFDASGSFGNSDKSNIDDIAGSGLSINSTEPRQPITFAGLVRKTIIDAIDFISNTLENVTVSNIEDNSTLTFTVFSKKLEYPNISSDNFIQNNAQARLDWFTVTERVKEMLTGTSIVLNFKDDYIQ